MQRLSESQKSFLREATDRYRLSLPGSPGEEYLATRGLVTSSPEVQAEIDRFMLGYVGDPLPGHEMYRGMLAIPYLRWSYESRWQVVSIRFRRLDGDEKPKYLTVAGDQPWLYNTLSLIKHSPEVAITEGEIDCITAHLCGIPSVGVPGVQTWKPYMRELFLGYRDVYVFADGDPPGMDFAERVASSIPGAKVIPMPEGEDVNSVVMGQGGRAALLERIRR
ncbi:DNA primase [Mycobacterium phage Chadwick]|uniref:DNA primase n=1 Tax=Mycobacterium phage Chadwick TaxID=1698366 RepID=A0A0K2CMW9_9CAUD|nr:DNA primase [Mycobacterium phage Chadwick]ALA06784.1 DNA primase [Mycobacterium phage Chadwick]